VDWCLTHLCEPGHHAVLMEAVLAGQLDHLLARLHGVMTHAAGLIGGTGCILLLLLSVLL
jgi:hypothetical protein